MSDAVLLAGSLSNDLLRVASLTQRNALKAASRFLKESQRWSVQLEQTDTKLYIKKIAQDISAREITDLSDESAERYLMYGILLQNFSLHAVDEK